MAVTSARLLLDPAVPITCPGCGKEYPLSDCFARQALESFESSSQSAIAAFRQEERARVEQENAMITREREIAHEKSLAQVRQVAEASLKPQVDALRTQLADREAKLATLEQREAAVSAREKTIESRVAESAATRAAELVAGERQAHIQQLQERDRQLADSRAAELALRKEKRTVEDRAAALEVEVARKLDQGRAEIEARAKAAEQEKSGLEKAELQKTIADMRTQLIEAQRKADQGSQQLQGEVMELILEETLRRAFPLDVIEEVKKGQRGGDVLQRVMTRTGQDAGTILWETKRASAWQASWTGKLKEDMRGCGAAVGILVTQSGALPRDWESGSLFAIYDDIWVTHAATAAGIAQALRSGLIDVHRQRALSAGKGEKAEALFEYLTSPQFANKLKGVYGSFKAMREELESERNVTQQRWARREKQLQAGVAQLLGIAGDIQGLSHQEIASLNLELPLLEQSAGD